MIALALLGATPARADVESRVAAVMPKVVAWRRDIHQHPELSNREVRTAKLVADHLQSLGLEVKTGVAHTGVVGVLRGGAKGGVVALRADMDALPVTEEVDLPFKSTARATFGGKEVGVMHACGHDNHTAILMGVAEVLAGMREELPGTVKFIFQPAEEGPPAGEKGGAKLMIAEGVLDEPKPAAIFGLHVWPEALGAIATRPGPMMAASDQLAIVVTGKQTHGALPWGGVDPIVVASQIVLALQSIPSRQLDVTKGPAILTIGSIQGGNRWNIIPETVTLEGTLRTFDEDVRKDAKERVRRTAERIAESAGATATVTFPGVQNFVTANDAALAERMRPSLERASGKKLVTPPLVPVSEDFSEFQRKIPGLFFFLGVTPEGQDPAKAPRNHSPRFFADEAALPVGVRAMTNLALDYLRAEPR
ncbi:MAG: amidohydrolase [Candidatus Binatia bacterium]